jgi:hypothetical protein
MNIKKKAKRKGTTTQSPQKPNPFHLLMQTESFYNEKKNTCPFYERDAINQMMPPFFLFLTIILALHNNSHEIK